MAGRTNTLIDYMCFNQSMSFNVTPDINQNNIKI